MILELQSIYKDYLQGKDAVSVLKDICLCVDEEEYVAIMGPSGSGKSTLMNIIGCLDKQTSGIFLFDDIDIAECSDKELSEIRNRKIGFVFQNFNLLPRESAIENVELPLLYAGIKKKERRELAEQALIKVGLKDRMTFRPTQLSGGQKRRVAVAGVMAMRPRILVLDEPAAGLDPEGRDDILSEVKEYHKKTGTTVLLVSHSMEDIAKYANRVLVMSNKKIAMYDTVEKVFARAPELLRLGLSVPQVTKIFLKLREMGVDVPADVYTIPYAVKMILEAKRRREAGESLVLPREAKKEGGAAGC